MWVRMRWRLCLWRVFVCAHGYATGFVFCVCVSGCGCRRGCVRAGTCGEDIITHVVFGSLPLELLELPALPSAEESKRHCQTRWVPCKLPISRRRDAESSQCSLERPATNYLLVAPVWEKIWPSGRRGPAPLRWPSTSPMPSQVWKHVVCVLNPCHFNLVRKELVLFLHV